MLPSARLFLCARCRVQVVLYRACDREEHYCDLECASTARRERQRESRRRHAASRRIRLDNAARQARWRARQRSRNALEVTEHPSDTEPARASSANAPETAADVLVDALASIAISPRCRPAATRVTRFSAAASCHRRHAAHESANVNGNQRTATTRDREIEGQILRYNHVERWGVNTICRHLLGHGPMWWTLLADRRVPLNNNLAERVLCPYVIWRKVANASQSRRGDRFRAVVLSVTMTGRQLGVPTYAYLRRIYEESLSLRGVTTLLPLGVPRLPA